MAAVEGQATQLDFHQAMEDFKTMFPDVDADVIEVINLSKAFSFAVSYNVYRRNQRITS